MKTEDEIKVEYPLHFLIWNDDFEELENALKNKEVSVFILLLIKLFFTNIQKYLFRRNMLIKSLAKNFIFILHSIY